MARTPIYVSATEFQRAIGATIDDVRTGKHIVIVQSHGRDQVALVPVDRYAELLRSEKIAMMNRSSVTIK